jgi:hypothetical protein
VTEKLDRQPGLLGAFRARADARAARLALGRPTRSSNQVARLEALDQPHHRVAEVQRRQAAVSLRHAEFAARALDGQRHGQALEQGLHEGIGDGRALGDLDVVARDRGRAAGEHQARRRALEDRQAHARRKGFSRPWARLVDADREQARLAAARLQQPVELTGRVPVPGRIGHDQDQGPKRRQTGAPP